MAVFESIELGLQHADGVVYGRGSLLVFQLQQQAFAKIPGAYSRRLELLDHLEHLLHLFGR